MLGVRVALPWLGLPFARFSFGGATTGLLWTTTEFMALEIGSHSYVYLKSHKGFFLVFLCHSHQSSSSITSVHWYRPCVSKTNAPLVEHKDDIPLFPLSLSLCVKIKCWKMKMQSLVCLHFFSNRFEHHFLLKSKASPKAAPSAWVAGLKVSGKGTGTSWTTCRLSVLLSLRMSQRPTRTQVIPCAPVEEMSFPSMITFAI